MELLALLLAGLASAEQDVARRSRAHELRGRLGLAGEEVEPIILEMQRVERVYGLPVASLVTVLLAGPLGLEEARMGRSWRPFAAWLAEEVSAEHYTDGRKSREDLRYVFDWWNQTRVEIQGQTFLEAWEAAYRWHQRLAVVPVVTGGRPTPGVVVATFLDGSRMERIWTEKQLHDEGRVMGHCVGGYAHRSGTRLYSLRDATGKSEATLEMKPSGFLVQAKGFSNADQTKDKRVKSFVLLLYALRTTFSSGQVPPRKGRHWDLFQKRKDDFQFAVGDFERKATREAEQHLVDQWLGLVWTIGHSILPALLGPTFQSREQVPIKEMRDFSGLGYRFWILDEENLLTVLSPCIKGGRRSLLGWYPKPDWADAFYEHPPEGLPLLLFHVGPWHPDGDLNMGARKVMSALKRQYIDGLGPAHSSMHNATSEDLREVLFQSELMARSSRQHQAYLKEVGDVLSKRIQEAKILSGIELLFDAKIVLAPTTDFLLDVQHLTGVSVGLPR